MKQTKHDKNNKYSIHSPEIFMGCVTPTKINHNITPPYLKSVTSPVTSEII